MNTLISALTEFVGRSYTPITYIVGEDTVVAAGFAGVDWPWLCSVALLIVVLYSVLRLIGGVLRG